MTTQFPTEYLFRRLPDFWSFFDGREDIKNAWDAYVRKTQALNSLLRQADLSKSLKTVPIFDRSDLEYFVFSKLARRTDLETNGPFYVFEIDSETFYIANLNEKIDDVAANRVLSPPTFYDVYAGQGADAGKTFLRFFRGVSPGSVGQTVWTKGSDLVDGSGFTSTVKVDQLLQGQDGAFYRVTEVVSDTQVRIAGPAVRGEALGAGDGAQTVYQLAATEDVIPDSVTVYFDDLEVPTANYTVSTAGLVTFGVAPLATVKVITADYHRGYTGLTATARKTVRESIPIRLFSKAVYRDRKAIYKNFGSAIGLNKPSSVQYLNEVRGIYFARYNGPAVDNLSLGSGILVGLPFSERGRVTRVNAVDPKSVLVDGAIIPVPPPLTPSVMAGEDLPKDFNLLTDGVRTVDFRNDPEFFALEPLKSDPAKFFTFFVLVKGAYALHVATQTGQPIDYAALKKFIRDIKPTYTDAGILTDLDHVSDGLNLFVGAVDVMNALDAQHTLEFNPINYTVIPEFLSENSFADEDSVVVAGVADMDLDSVGLYETLDPIYDVLFIDTHENNLVNFLVSPPGPEEMDSSSVLLTEEGQIHEAVGTPPGSGNPPFTQGALILDIP